MSLKEEICDLYLRLESVIQERQMIVDEINRKKIQLAQEMKDAASRDINRNTTDTE